MLGKEVREILTLHQLHVKVPQHPVGGGAVNTSSGCGHYDLLHKEREVNEVLRKVHHSVESEVVLCLKQGEGLPGVVRGVKGHGEHIVANVPTSVLVFLIGLAKPSSEEEEEQKKNSQLLSILTCNYIHVQLKLT